MCQAGPVQWLKRLRDDERARFVVIGGINTVTGYALFLGFEAILSGNYLASIAASYAIATVIAFILHRRFTFAVTQREGVVIDFLRFESVYVVMLAVNAGLLLVLVGWWAWPSWLAQAVIVVITTVGSYLGHKMFSFRGRERSTR